ncbi:mitochondrial inner membrane i-AAA protease complex subunit [Scheffersomyces spartinae]|uniref:Mitochondrial inner membrane i-AAA protease complex subunit n=1 Tax=Scheffersomyces spartinae TaxID=45513 RepID=A0A9P7V9L5_9ASCO|nr:mitochondrial inner membrane i-AAA protease complex subunit [Scheffersomyces spartinae]KAG7193821.1 mitochondrial inner membrane i-AAA protease complex subunit [Scheffersomyces spartinae]
MGVYIPPPPPSGNGTGEAPEDESTKQRQNKTPVTEQQQSNTYASNIAKIPTVNKLLTMIFPNVKFPQNPSFGLRMWGPLVPASDNHLALYGLATFQAMIGMYMLGRARRLRKANFLRAGIPYPKGRLRDNLILIGVGSIAVFQSGLEYSRLLLLGSMDPWSVEASHYRNIATENGKKPSAWFGAYDSYTPMNIDEYRKKLRRYIEVNENYMNKTSEAWKLGKVLDYQKYSLVYDKMVKQNQALTDDLLKGRLKDMTELNKAERLDGILEGSSDVQVVEDIPTIHLGNHKLDSDDDLDFVWGYVNPWEELNGGETIIRLFPRSLERVDELLASTEENPEDHEKTQTKTQTDIIINEGRK